MRFEIYSGDKINFPDGTQGAVLRGRNVDNGKNDTIFVPPALAGDILANWNTGKRKLLEVALTGEQASIDRSLSATNQQFGSCKGQPATIDARTISAVKPIGSGREEVLYKITAIDMGGFISKLTGMLNGSTAEVYVATSDLKAYPQVQGGNEKAFLGYQLVMTGGVVKVGLPGNRFMGYGPNFIRPMSSVSLGVRSLVDLTM